MSKLSIKYQNIIKQRVGTFIYRIFFVLLSISLLFVVFDASLSKVSAAGADDFVTTWKTDNTGDSADNQVFIHAYSGTYNFNVDWENDGIVDDFNVTGDILHTYATPGTYTIRISGVFPWFRASSVSGLHDDSGKIMSVDQWGTIAWGSMNFAFEGCENMVMNATDIPDLSSVTNAESMFNGISAINQDLNGWNVSSITTISSMFKDISGFNQNISSWDMSNVVNMGGMFWGTSFNQDISGWDVSSATWMPYLFYGNSVFNQDISGWNMSLVTNTGSMFHNSSAFNQDIGGWDTGNVTSMSFMFSAATSFDQDISSWDTSNVEYMNSMFKGTDFNQNIGVWDVGSVLNFSYMFQNSSFDMDISGWNTTNVTNMYDMFNNAYEFNQDIGGWDVSSVANMYGAFMGATSFDQDLGSWDVSSVTDFRYMFNSITLSTANYDSILNNWSLLILQPGETFDGGNSTYCNGAAARASIISTYSWIITDGGAICPAASTDYFITTWKTDNVGTSGDNQITIPLLGGPYVADWDNDGIVDQTGINGAVTHTFPGGAGTYTIRLYADSPRIEFGGVNGGDRDKLLSVDQWGDGTWVSMSAAFMGCSNVSIGASDVPDLTSVTDMISAFRDATSFNSDIGGWDLSNVTSFSHTFAGASSFNQDISGWDTGSALSISYMFWDASSFNQNIGGWDVSSVTDFSAVFTSASAFNQDISSWILNSANTTYAMFAYASSFNQDISGWNVSGVTTMAAMFRDASSFNQDISGWDVSSVVSMGSLFRDAVSFNQDLGDWDVSGVTDMSNMFNGVALSTVNYDSILNAWSLLTLQNGVVFDGGNSTYCASSTSRSDIISIYSWVITDGGENCPNQAPEIISGGGGTNINIDVDENQVGVTTVVATDPELGDITYSIVGGADSALFSINSSTGVLTFITSPDYENPLDANVDGVYEVQVSASDGSLQDLQTISITVLDVDEVVEIPDSPEIISSDSIFILENETYVVTVFASSDEDITYSIVGGADSNLFWINPVTGVLVFINAPNYEYVRDYNYNGVYEVQVSASDGYSFDVQVIYVTVVDIQESPVIITDGDVEIVENQLDIITIDVVDSDLDEITYSITDGLDSDLFIIDPITGELTWNEVPDFENPMDFDEDGIYEVEISVSDGIYEVIKIIYVTVVDIEEAPEITTSNLIDLIENEHVVIIIDAIDSDLDEIFYSITGGVDADFFVIDRITGELVFKDSPDYESPRDFDFDGIYEVEISVSDGVNESTEAIAVRILNADDDIIPVFVGEEEEEEESNQAVLAIFTVVEGVLESMQPHTTSIGIAVGLTAVQSVGMFSQITPFVLQWVFGLLSLLGLRGKSRQYGFVYDSVSKEPVSRAVVRIYDLNKRLIWTDVTDGLGVFNAELEPGSYTIQVRKAGFDFPSVVVVGSVDAPIENVYHGETVETHEKSTVLYAIPLDRSAAKVFSKISATFKSDLKWFLWKVREWLFIGGMILASYAYYKYPDGANLFILSLYLIVGVFLLKSLLFSRPSFGKVVDANGSPVSGITLGLKELQFDRFVGKRITGDDGMYRFLVSSGRYEVVVLNDNYDVVKYGGGSNLVTVANGKANIVIDMDITVVKKS